LEKTKAKSGVQNQIVMELSKRPAALIVQFVRVARKRVSNVGTLGIKETVKLKVI
jgi:hypothetical protein